MHAILMFLYHHIYKKYLQRSINRKDKQDNLLLVAPYDQVETMVAQFNSCEISELKIVGIVLANSKAELEAATTSFPTEDSQDGVERGIQIEDIPVVGTLNNPFEYARTHVVDEVLICMDGEMAEQMAEMYTDMGIVAHVSIRNLVRLPKAVIGKVNGIPVITSVSNVVTQRQMLINEDVDSLIGLVVYFGLYYFYLSFLVKQMLSMAAIIYSYKYIKRKDDKKFIISILLAAMIHKSSIVFLPAIYLCRYVKFNRYFFAIVAGLISVGLFLPQYILNILYALPYFNFKAYILSGVYKEYFSSKQFLNRIDNELNRKRI